jgi:CheY-like chemotaxis protein
MAKQPLVLFVAHDGLTRREVASGLEMYGYAVLTAADAQDALSLMTVHRSRITVLVTDADMGGEVDGLAIATTARSLNPKVTVVYTARRPHAVPSSRQVSGAPLVRSPYHPHQLASVIAMVRHDQRTATLDAAA